MMVVKDMIILFNIRKNNYDHAGAEDQLIFDTIKHSYLTAALEGGWDANLEDISIEEIGHYGATLFTIDATKRPEDD